jgi:hypothetical protein
MRNGMKGTLVAGLMGLTVLVATVQAANFSAWGTPQKIDEIPGNSSELNTPFQDGCPIQSPNGLSLYQASNRPGGEGGLDIWVAHRESTDDPWGAPENLGAPVNSAADDFCPTPIQGGGLFFVSRIGQSGQLRAGRHLLHQEEPGEGLGGAAQPRLRAERAEHRARRAGPLVRGERRPGLPVLIHELGGRRR